MSVHLDVGKAIECNFVSTRPDVETATTDSSATWDMKPATTIRSCPHCGQPMLYPTQISERVGEKTYKRTGYTGTTFRPYVKNDGSDNIEARYRPERKFNVCGMCAAQHWGDEYLEDDSMDGNEFRDQLAALATMGNGARMDLLDAMKRGEIPTEKPATAPKRRKANRKTSRRNTRSKLPPMTATQATTFDRISVANATAVDAALSCGCVPYETVFTFRRWKAQGMSVVKGEKAIKIPVVKDVESTDADTGEVTKSKRVFGTAAVFCKCQVKPIGEKSQTRSQSEVAA
jgi:hypothetical protein